MSRREPIKPPKWAINLLEWFCPDSLYEGILGDMLEQFDEEALSKGLFRAKFKFVWTVVRFFHPSILLKNKKLKKNIDMGLFQNHLKVARRSMMKYKFYSIINVFGLTLAIAFVFLSYMFIYNESSYDNFHAKKDNIYRVYNYRQDIQSGEKIDGTTSAVTPVPLVKNLASEVSGIVDYVRYASSSGTIRMDNTPFNETISMVDPAFLSVFSFPVLHGSEKALDDPNSVVLSKEMAQKYFNLEDPIGKEIEIILNDSSKIFVVQGVVDNMSDASSIKFDLLIPFERMEMVTSDHFMNSNNVAFIESWIEFEQVPDNNIVETLTATLKKETDSQDGRLMIDVQPLTQVHFDTNNIGLAAYTSPQKLWILTALSLLVLVIATINFITLSSGHSMHRLKEVGLRKTLGAAKSSLRIQLIFESFIVVMLASILGLLIAFLVLPVFNQLVGGTLIWNIAFGHLVFIFLLSLIISLISGGVQSILLTKVTPLVALKGSSAFAPKEGWLNQGLIVVQFFLSMILIIGTLIIRDQMNYIQKKDLGFDKERLLEMPLHASNDYRATKMLVDRFKSVALQNPDIISVGASMNSFLEPWTQLFFAQLDGSDEGIYFNQIDVDYLETMQIKLIKGEGLHSGGSAATDILVNESLVKHFEWDNPFDKQIPGKNFEGNHRIVGVVEDFHFSSLHNKIEPIILAVNQSSISTGVTGLSTYQWPPNLYRMLVRIGPGDLMNSVAFLEKSWNKINPNKPFSFSFVDNTLANSYRVELRWSKIINYASFFAIIIAWVGLIGLVRLSVQKRTKEIGIRKVLGSSVINVTKSLSSKFLVLILISNVLSWPVAWWASGRWLESFTYRIDLNILTFVLAGTAVLLVALISVGWQSYRAAIANPVDSLKYE